MIGKVHSNDDVPYSPLLIPESTKRSSRALGCLALLSSISDRLFHTLKRAKQVITYSEYGGRILKHQLQICSITTCSSWRARYNAMSPRPISEYPAMRPPIIPRSPISSPIHRPMSRFRTRGKGKGDCRPPPGQAGSTQERMQIFGIQPRRLKKVGCQSGRGEIAGCRGDRAGLGVGWCCRVYSVAAVSSRCIAIALHHLPHPSPTLSLVGTPSVIVN